MAISSIVKRDYLIESLIIRTEKIKMKAITFIILSFLSFAIFAQDAQKKDASSIEKELLFFSNDGCGKCSISQSYFDKHQMPYQKLAIRENRPLMYEFIHKKTGGKNIGIGYPVLVYGDSIYFSIKNLNAVLLEIEEMMIKDKLIVKNKKE